MLVKLKQHLIMFALTREIQQNINFLCRVIFGHEWVKSPFTQNNVNILTNLSVKDVKLKCFYQLVGDSSAMSRSSCRHCSRLSRRSASMSAGRRRVRPTRRRSALNAVGRGRVVRGRPLNVATPVSAK